MRLCERRERRRRKRGGILSRRALCVHADPRHIDCGWKLCLCVTAGDYTKRHNRSSCGTRGRGREDGEMEVGPEKGK